ncbi:LLM class flavin-dependent oxidoreductase [Nocardioides bizhenqiangii]|uniref:LLM class flavin-dependent oxidoreductase n=1 Tax=Nocardioides bizhenqiangii TaxID=3095076 RepID=A0ABZ0ZVQ1_9ACTN|nr:LLM class flavin-dependent oxidoreductase [Nocardioides sp. HM61]WQQ28389.1 LLM class flavin-dependent oxidoreductase [Nocardioides sp. HM61]
MTRSAVWVPLFDDLADPRVAVDLAVAAEEAGWDGFFVWDHLRWHEPVVSAGDPWVALAAIAAATDRIRLGTLVTAVARRRPAKLARETAALDLLSGGRVSLGVGLGSDRFGGEFSLFGEETDERARAAMLDEALEILRGAWSGEPVHHRGDHYAVDGVRFLPRPTQRTIPIWVAGFPGKARPRQRAARNDGFFPVNLADPDQLAEEVAAVTALRDDPTAPYDVIAAVAPGADPSPYADAGATWCVTDTEAEGLTLDTVRGLIADGPFR